MLVNLTAREIFRGHNELDEPAFTQPLMYKNIRNRRSVPEMYEERIVVSLSLFL